MNIVKTNSQEKFTNTVISCILLRFRDNDKENKTINNNKNSRVCKEDMMSLLSKVKDYKGLFSATALSAALTFAPNALAQDFTKTSHQPTPQTAPLRAHSELVPDEYGTLWFRQGADSDTKYSMAQDVSVEDGGKIVIVAASEPSISAQAVNIGRQLEGWLEANSKVDKDVVLVAADDVPSGGGFTYFIDGLRFTTPSNVVGVFSPRDASAELPNVVTRYVVTMELNAQEDLAMTGAGPVLAAR